LNGSDIIRRSKEAETKERCSTTVHCLQRLVRISTTERRMNRSTGTRPLFWSKQVRPQERVGGKAESIWKLVNSNLLRFVSLDCGS